MRQIGKHGRSPTRRQPSRRQAAKAPPARREPGAVTFNEMLRQDLKPPDDWAIELEVEVDQPADDTEYDLSEIGGVEGLSRLIANAVTEALATVEKRR